MRRWPTLAGIAYPVLMGLVSLANVYFQFRLLNSKMPADWRDAAPIPGGLALTTMTAIAGLLIARRPKNPIGWLMVFITLTAFVTFYLGPDYGAYGLYVAPGSLPQPLLPSWIAGFTGSFFFVSIIVVLPLIFPDGRLLSAQWTWVLVPAGFSILLGLPQPLDPNFFAGDHLANPYALTLFSGYAKGPLPTVGTAFAAIAGLLGAASVVVRYRQSGSDVRHQIKWFGAAIALLALVFASQSASGHQTGPALPVAVVAVGAAIAVAVLKYRLYDIDIVISRTLVYGSLAAFITAVYVGIVVGVGTVIGAGGRPNLLLSIIATAIVAVAFQPVRERLQKIANRLVYGKRATPYEVLSQFSERVAETYAADEALPRMARVLAEGTGAERASVWLRTGADLRPAATWPEASGNGAHASPGTVLAAGNDLPKLPADRAVAVRHQGELLGALAVTKRQGETLTPVEEKLLADLASQAGLVLKNVGLTAELVARLDDLRASRQRLVAAQDEERRRLERNLHDGAQQNLVALKVKLGLAESMADKDPAKAQELLGQIKADADEALETLRDLARGIYPPLLADRGLTPALEAQARKATVPVTVEADGVERYPQDIEAAVYFCVLEALQNVQKYAGATSATVALVARDGELAFAVSDNGQGFDVSAAQRGAGTTNMADRLDALGGSLELESTPGSGTTVSGRVPVTLASAA